LTGHRAIDLDIIETQTTRDRIADDGIYIVAPPGLDWVVLSARRERHTVWTRRRSVVLPWRT
jgi:hypothetical protein